MKFEEFKKELDRQIGINAKYFKPKEIVVLGDFCQTINASDFDKEEVKDEQQKQI